MAITPSIYHVLFSDAAENPGHQIIIQPGQVDNSTSILLPGAGKIDYGQFMDQNILNMLENFSRNVPPSLPINGQLWFNKGQSRLRVYDEKFSSDPVYPGWASLIATRFGSSAPVAPADAVGDMYYNTTTGLFSYWDGTVWQDLTTSALVGTNYYTKAQSDARFVLKAGDTMTGPLVAPRLTVNGANGTNRPLTFTTNNVSRWSVGAMSDVESGGNTGSNFGIGRVNDAGVTIDVPFTIIRSTGAATFYQTVSSPLAPTVPAHLTNKAYVDGQIAAVNSTINVVNANKVSRAGDSMTGYLTLAANPVNPLHAATKQYVDSAIATSSSAPIFISPVMLWSSPGFAHGLNWTTFNITPYIGSVNAKYAILQTTYVVTQPDGGDVVCYIWMRGSAGWPRYTADQGGSWGSRDANSSAAQVLCQLAPGQVFDLYVGNSSFTGSFDSATVELIGYVL